MRAVAVPRRCSIQMAGGPHRPRSRLQVLRRTEPLQQTHGRFGLTAAWLIHLAAQPDAESFASSEHGIQRMRAGGSPPSARADAQMAQWAAAVSRYLCEMAVGASCSRRRMRYQR